MTDRLAEIEAKLRNGQTLTYDDAADIFELTIVGSATMKHNALTREDIVTRITAKFPDPAKLTKYCRAIIQALDAMRGQGMH